MVTENVNIIVTTRGATVASQQIRSIGTSSRIATVAVRALGAALVLVAGGATIGAMFRLADSATEVSNRIRTTTQTTEQFLSVQDRLFTVANKTGAGIEDTARLFQRLSVATRDIGVGSERVISVVGGLNAALLVSGSTAREASAALLQLGQGLASDNLSGEELRSLRENLPQLAQGLAKELGVGIGALKELGRQGKLSAETVFPALERAVASFQEKLENGEVVFTFAQAFNAVRNEVVKAFEIIQRATGITQTLNKTIFEFADGLAESIVRGVANVVDFVAKIVDGFAELQQSFGNILNLFKPLITAFGFLGKVGVVAVQGLVVAFNGLLSSIAGANSLLQRFLRFIGVATDTDVAIADATFFAQADTVNEEFEQLFETIDKFGDASFLELATGIDNVGSKASKLGDTLRDVGGSLRAATAAPPLANVPDAPPPTFFERADENRKRIQDESGFEAVDVPVDLAEGITQSFQQGFAAAIQNGDDIFQAISDNFEAAANQALVNGFQDAFDTVQGLLEESFKSATTALKELLPGAFDGIGGVFANALGGAIQFVALQALSALFGGGGNKESRSNGNIQSAVTSTQAVRGIVAGPTEIAIANVGQNIAEAVEPLLQETVIQTTVLREILGAVVSSGGTLGGFGADAQALAAGGAPLATS